jgi:LysR family transcriptional activator of nhaA
MKNTIDNPDGLQRLARTNLNHLVYFWAVARSGSITSAASLLRISQSTMSEQIKALEQRLGATLLERGRAGAVLTPAGQRAFRYADEAVGVCSQLMSSLPLEEEHTSLPVLRVGTADAVPKLVVTNTLKPLLDVHEGLSIECREWRIDHLLSELSLHRLDIVLTDAPVEHESVPAMSTLSVGDSAVVLLAAPTLAKTLRENFPKSLHNAPLLLPTVGSALRARVERWLAQRSLMPRIVVAAEDRAIMHHFAQAGVGTVPAPELVATQLCKQFGLQRVATLDGCRDEFFALIMQRSDPHPAIQTLRSLLETSPKAASKTRKRAGSK